MNIDVKKALYFVHDAWNSMNPEKISACWTHTGILSAPTAAELTANRGPNRTRDNELQELGNLLEDLHMEPDNRMTPFD